MRHNAQFNVWDTIRLNFPIIYNNFCSVTITRIGFADEDFSSTSNIQLRILAHTSLCTITLSSIVLGNRHSHCLIAIGS